MEQEIILEGIHAMLEEIRDNLKKNPEVETIKLKLETIEKVCNELTGQKFVTEDVLAQFLVCTLQKIVEMNKKQEEKMERIKECILGHHKHSKEQIIALRQNISIVFIEVKKLSEKNHINQGFFRRFFN